MNSLSMPRRWGSSLVELLGSMRFAVSLLVFVCVASLIGTVLQQNQAPGAYIDLFGPFWFAVFDKFSIWHIYNSWWFLLIMSFLVVSTTVCLVRNTPKMVRDARSFREYVRANSLRSFRHRVELDSSAPAPEMCRRVQDLLRRQGYRSRVREDAAGTMIAAKKGSANRLGYIFTHGAIVIILIGGLLDSELPVRLQVWLGGKHPITQNMLISDVPQSGRLSVNNPSYRANVFVPEGDRSSSGIVGVGEGVLIQPLPFTLRLKKFLVDYYSTGMPSSFKSEVEVIDHQTGNTFERTIEVNEPLRYRGVTVYQSSFDDGGSKVQLQAYPLAGADSRPFEVSGTVGERSDIAAPGADGRKFELDVSGLRVINVENMGSDVSPQPKPLLAQVAAVTGSAGGARNENLKNVGPSVQYRLIGEDGQSHEYNNYMMPLDLDGHLVFLAGVRDSPSDNYRYLRIPADDNNSVAEFMRLRAALDVPELREEAARRFAAGNASSGIQVPLLEKAASGALESFSRRGFEGIIDKVPVEDREKILGFAVPMIQLSLAQLRDLERANRGEAPAPHSGPEGEKADQWIRLALLALANLPDYPAPVFLSLQNFQQVEASVFQVARSPGKNIVYLGAILLVLGVFSMFYVRDRRAWIWVKPKDDGGSEVMAAMTSHKRTLDFEHEFHRFQEAFKRLSN